MKIIKRIPSQEEIDVKRFNRRISRIQTVCHILAGVCVMVGICWTLFGVGVIENATISDGIWDAVKGLGVLSFGALLANM